MLFSVQYYKIILKRMLVSWVDSQNIAKLQLFSQKKFNCSWSTGTSYSVIRIFPVHIGWKNELPSFNIVRPLYLRKTWLRACYLIVFQNF